MKPNSGYYTVRTIGDVRHIQRKPFHLPFNGELSVDEQRMLEQFAFEVFDAKRLTPEERIAA